MSIHIAGAKSGKTASVDDTNRLETRAITTLNIDAAGREGRAFTVPSNSLTLTGSDTTHAMLRLVSQEDSIVRLVIVLPQARATDGTEDFFTVGIWGGTSAISGATTGTILNTNPASSRLFNGVLEVATAAGSTFTGGGQGTGRFFDVGKGVESTTQIYLGKGDSLGVSIRTPAGNTALTESSVLLGIYIIDPDPA